MAQPLEGTMNERDLCDRPLAAERRAYLLGQLEAHGSVRTRSAADAIGVAEMTVARDLRNLADAGLCRRVYGGAVSMATPTLSDRRRVREDDGAAAAAAKAVALIWAGARVVLDGGQIMVLVARSIPLDLTCSVITRSPAVAHSLAGHGRLSVHLIGGSVSPVSGQSSGAAAAERALGVEADLMFVGVDGVHLARGLTVADADDATLKRLLIGRSSRSYVVMTGSQFGTASDHRVTHLTGVTGLITDRLLPGARRLTEDQRIRVV